MDSLPEGGATCQLINTNELIILVTASAVTLIVRALYRSHCSRFKLCCMSCERDRGERAQDSRDLAERTVRTV